MITDFAAHCQFSIENQSDSQWMWLIRKLIADNRLAVSTDQKSHSFSKLNPHQGGPDFESS